MIIDIIAALILFSAINIIGVFALGMIGGAVGAVFGSDRAIKVGAWVGVGAFCACMLIFALAVAL